MPQVALEVEAARKAAEAQARIEVEALQQRLRCVMWTSKGGAEEEAVDSPAHGQQVHPHIPPAHALPAPPPSRTMEEYVEDADAKRLAAASRAAELEQQLAGAKRGEEDTYSQVGGGLGGDGRGVVGKGYWRHWQGAGQAAEAVDSAVDTLTARDT